MTGKADHRGFGHVRRLPSKRVQASYVGPDMQRHTAPSTFDTKQDAEAWLATERVLINTDTWSPPKNRRTARALTFADYSASWIADRDLKPRTVQHYTSLLDRLILPTFGDMALRSITPAAVRAWHGSVAGATPTLRAHSYSLLRAILTTAVQDDVIPANPCRIRAAGQSKRKVEIRPATLPELETLTTAMPEKYRAMILLASWCAMRFGEITELRRKDVDLRHGVIHVKRAVAWVGSKPVVGLPKSDAGVRDIAIPPHLLPLIRDHIKTHAGIELLFPSPAGTHLTTSTFYASYWPARGKASRPDLRFHDLRHTGAVLAAQTGATLAELMGRLGHSTPAAALRYQHAAKGRDAEIAALLSKLAEAP